jgi:polyhydroxyalkanoate synthase
VINPASKGKRSYWVNDLAGAGNSRKRQRTAPEWLATAVEHKGSWWPEWAGFLAQHGGAEVAAPAAPGKGSYQALEAAPGRYVKERAA